MHIACQCEAGCAGAHAGCSEDTDMPSALPDIGQSLFDDEDCLLSVDLPLGALARCAALDFNGNNVNMKIAAMIP